MATTQLLPLGPTDPVDEARVAIWRLFQENGITIPVAQREISVHMSDRNPIAHDV